MCSVHEQDRRNGKAQGLGGSHIDDLFEPRGLLDRDVAWLGTLQDFVHMVRRLPVELSIVRPIGHETAGLNHGPVGKHRRQAMLQRELGDAGTRRCELRVTDEDRKSTCLNSSHVKISYAVFCLKKK